MRHKFLPGNKPLVEKLNRVLADLDEAGNFPWASAAAAGTVGLAKSAIGSASSASRTKMGGKLASAIWKEGIGGIEGLTKAAAQLGGLNSQSQQTLSKIAGSVLGGSMGKAKDILGAFDAVGKNLMRDEDKVEKFAKDIENVTFTMQQTEYIRKNKADFANVLTAFHVMSGN